MNKKLVIVLLVLMFLASLTQLVSARKGVGIVWNTETEIVTEGATHCIEYGIYNPWDEDVTATLHVSEELKKIITKEDSEPKFVKAETYHENALPIELCFKVAKVYSKQCLLSGVLCEQTCDEPQVEYNGNVLAKEEQTGGTTGTGSATSLGVAVPLKLKVACTPHSRNYTPIYIMIILLALLLIGWMLYNKQKTNKSPEIQ